MPLTLDDNELWERIRGLEGKVIQTPDRRESLKVLELAETANRMVFVQNMRTSNIRRVLREHVTHYYRHLDQQGKVTRENWPKNQVPVVVSRPIMAMLAAAVPEEIEAFTRDEGEGLSGIRKKDC